VDNEGPSKKEARRLVTGPGGIEPPISSEAIKAVLAGIRRSLGVAPLRKAPGIAELVALDVTDLESNTDGVRVIIRRSKTDQEGAGDFAPIPNGTKLRPVAAILAWLEAACITEGPIFRPITRRGLTDCCG
jgi:hypothetical protein